MTLRYTLSILISLGCIAVQAQVSPVPARRVAQAAAQPTPTAQLAQPGTITPLASALPVTAHQRLTIRLRATTPAAPALTDQLLRAAAAAALAYGQSPPPTLSLPEQTATPRRRMPYLGAGVALALTPELRPQQPAPAAYVQYRFYNADSVLVAAQRQPLTRRAHQTLTLATTLPTDGYVEVAFVNERPAPVQLTDLSIQLAETTPQRPLKGHIAEAFGAQRNGVCLGPVVVTSPPYCQVYPERCQGPPTNWPPMDWPPYNPNPSDPPPPTGPPPTTYPGGGGSGGGGGNTGSTGGPETMSYVLPNICAGYTAALNLQDGSNKEINGFVTTGGQVLIMPAGTANNAGHFEITYPVYDANNHLVTNAPFPNPDGTWTIEYNNWIFDNRTSSWNHTVSTYTVTSAFHTHPIGGTNDSDNPSPDDLYDMNHVFVGLPRTIVNRNNIVNYNGTTTVTSSNTCP